jgi:hypothetical protein
MKKLILPLFIEALLTESNEMGNVYYSAQVKDFQEERNVSEVTIPAFAWL